jgi:protein phosphatase
MLDLEFTQITDPGRIRGHNEDYVGYSAPATPAQARSQGWLFALADGVGGHEDGEVASRAAVESVVAGFARLAGRELHNALLPRLVRDANTVVVDLGMGNGSKGPAMATTFVACALRYDRAVICHVGDSRCYLIRGDHARLLTRDHTIVNEQVRLGVLSTKEAAESASKHVLSRSLGSDLSVAVETSEHQINAGDVLLLCSDGLHGAIEAREMSDFVKRSADLDMAAQKLVALANERDGSDNISVQLIRIRGVERVGMYRGRPYKLR